MWVVLLNFFELLILFAGFSPWQVQKRTKEKPDWFPPSEPQVTSLGWSRFPSAHCWVNTALGLVFQGRDLWGWFGLPLLCEPSCSGEWGLCPSASAWECGSEGNTALPDHTLRSTLSSAQLGNAWNGCLSVACLAGGAKITWLLRVPDFSREGKGPLMRTLPVNSTNKLLTSNLVETGGGMICVIPSRPTARGNLLSAVAMCCQRFGLAGCSFAVSSPNLLSVLRQPCSAIRRSTQGQSPADVHHENKGRHQCLGGRLSTCSYSKNSEKVDNLNKNV